MAQVKNHHSNENHVSANGNVANGQLLQQIQRAQLLNKITTHFDHDFDQQIQHGLNLIREEFNFDNAIVSHIEGDDYIIQFIDSAENNDAKGQTLELGTTYCNLVQSSEEVVVINHASKSEYKEHPCYQATKLESYIGAPLYISDQFYGTVTFSTQEPYPDLFTEIDIEFIKAVANWISGVLTRKQTTKDLNKTLHEMETLYQYTAVLNESTTIEEAFLAAIQPSINAGASSASLLTITVDDKNRPEFLDLLYTWSKNNEETIPLGSRFAVQDFESSKYWIEKRGPILVGNIAEDERFSEAGKAVYKQAGAEATVIYPLILGEKWVGVISLNWNHKREFTAVDERQYQSMANQTASVLNNFLLNEQEQKRAQQLQTVAEVSTAVANILDPEEFLQTVVTLTRDQFNLYHAHIYLYDEETETLTLRSGAGEIGRIMVAEGRSIPISQEQSLVARAARTKEGFIINDVKSEPGFLEHPLLPRTASEMAVPIIRQDEMLGVLDVQSDHVNNFSQDDLLVLTSFGAQIATALKNAQAFEQVVQAEKTAQVSQARTEAILKSVSLPLVITRISDGLAMYANKPLAETLRMELDEIIGQRSPDFYYDANDRVAFLKTIQEQGYAQNYEVRLKRIDGEPFWALVSSRPLVYDGDNAIITTITDITDRKQAQERTETILKSVNLPLAITRISDGYGLYANEPFAETFKISTEEFIGQKSPNFYANPEDRAGLLAGVEKDGYIRNYEALLKRHTGETFWAILSSRAIVYEGHESIMTTILDITERKEAAEALRRQEEELEILLEASPEAIGVVNTKTGLFESPNKQAEILYGLSREELVKVGPAEMSPEFQPDGRPSAEKAMEKIGEAMHGGTPVFEWTHINSKGEEIPCEVRLVSLGRDRDHLVRFSVTDIRERKALQEELQLLKQAIDSSTQPITIADARQKDMPLVYINPAFVDVTGYSIEETFGKNCRFLQNDDVDQEGLETLRQAIKNGESCDVEIRNYRKDGTLFWNRLNLSPVKDATGQVTHYIGSQRDVTRQKEDAQRLAKQAADLATVAEVSTAVSTIQNTNEMLQTVVDLTKERFNLYHAHIFTLDNESDALVLRAGAGEVGREMVAEGRQIPLTAEGSLVAAVGRNKTGQIRNYEGEMEGYAPHPALIDTRTELAVPLVVGDELLGVLDVRSEQANAFTETDVQIQTTLASQVAIALQNARSFEQIKTAESELRENQAQLQAILDNLPVGVFVADAKTGVPQLANNMALEILGRGLDPSGAEEYSEVYQTYFPDKDELLPSEELPLVKTMTTGDIHYGEVDIVRPDGRITVDVTAVPIFDDSKNIRSAIALFQDITERKLAETQLREAQERSQTILESISVPLLISRVSDGVILYANEQLADLIVIDLEDLIDQPTPNFYFQAEDRQTVISLIREHGSIKNYELHLRRNNGEAFWGLLSAKLFSYQGEIAILTSLIDITDRKSAQESITKQAAELRTVADISTTVSTTLDTDSLLQNVVDLTKENFNLYHAHIYLIDDEHQNLVLTAGAGEVGRQMVAEKRSIPLDRQQSLVAQAAQTRTGVIVNDTHSDENFLPHPLLPNTKAEMAIPMIVGNDLLGVLDVQADKTGHFNEQDINIQTTLASQIAIALQNARQYEQTQAALAETASQAQSLEQLTALSLALTEVSSEKEAYQTVALYASQIVHSQRTSIAILNIDKTHLELFALDGTQGSIPTGMILPVEGTAIGRVSQGDQILTITDTANSEFMDAKKLSQTGILSTIVAPLMIGNEVIGTMNFGLTEKTTASLRREQLIQQIAALFGQSLANSRLLSQIQQQATQLRTVAELGTNISTIQNPQEMLQVMVDLTKERFGLYHSHVFLLNDTKDTLILTAGAGDIGREMVLAGRQIPLSAEQSLVATVARTRKGIIRNYAEEMEGFMPHPLLLDTRSELAVPIIVGDEVLGVLDVRSEHLNAFDETDVQIQSTLASQAAVALQNARQFEATEKARRELTVLTQRLTHEGWGEFLHSKPTGSLRFGYNLQNIQMINEDDYIETSSPNILTTPVEIQGAQLGRVNLHMPEQPDQETKEMVEAIVHNLSAHIENLRLTEQTYTALAETEAQAERLANLNDISALLGQSTNLRELYNNTATQIMEMFDADRVSITMLDANATKLNVVAAIGDETEAQTDTVIDLEGTPMAQAIALKDFVDNSTENLQTIIHIPVLAGNEAIGTINLAKHHKEVINDSDRNLLRQVANMLSINMTNQKLFAAAQNRAERERRVRAITDRIRRGGDRDTILKIAREEIGQLLGAQKSMVHLGTQQQLLSKLRLQNEQDRKNGA